MNLFKRKEMAENTIITSRHIIKRDEEFKKMVEGNSLSTTVFNTTMEREKEAIIKKYIETYGKAIEEAEVLEAEKSKLKVGKKSFEQDKDGKFIEKQIFDEQAVQRIRKVTSTLETLYKAIDKTMEIGGKENWDNLAKLVK